MVTVIIRDPSKNITKFSDFTGDKAKNKAIDFFLKIINAAGIWLNDDELEVLNETNYFEYSQGSVQLIDSY